MPTFSSAQVTDPFLSTNELLAPMLAYVDRDSKLGTLDVNRQRLGLEQAKLDQQRAAGAALLGGGDGTTGTGTTGTGTTESAGSGVGGSIDPPPIASPAGEVAQRTAAFWSGQGFTPEQVAGIMAGGPGAESSFNPTARGDGDTSYGLYQHHLGRKEMMQARYGQNPTEAQQHEFAAWEISPEGPLAAVGARLKQAKTPEEAARIWTLGFESPANAEARAAARAAVAPRYLNYGNAGPRVADAALAPSPVPPAAFNPNAGPRVAGAPPAGAPGPAAAAPGFGPLTPVPGAPTVTGQADVPAPVSPSAVALRTGGTDVAGPGAGPDTTLPPVAQPNRLYETGLPGIQITGPGNALAPPVAAAPVTPPAAPVTAPAGAAPPGTAIRPPPVQPPPAPSRAPAIPLEPIIQSGPAQGLTPSQRKIAAAMVAGGTPIADVGAHMAQWRQQNIAGQQQAATQTALEAQQNYDRQRQFRQDQVAAEESAYKRGRDTEADRIARERADRESAKAAAEAADPLQGKSEDERIERTLLQIAPKVRAGQTLTDAERDQYTLLWNKYREGPIQQVPDGKGGTFAARVPRDVPAQFPPPPGQAVAPGPQAIPGTEKQPELAPPAVTGGMLANGVGQRKIMAALSGLLAHPDAVGLKANAPDWLLQRTDPEGVRLRGDVSDVAGHEFHDLSGAAVSATEAARLKFIPSEKDTAEALKTKLQRMLDLNRETMLQSYRTYGPENGGRRLPVVEEAIVDSIPQAAIDLLTADPNGKARDFDKKYGKGAAKLVLR